MIDRRGFLGGFAVPLLAWSQMREAGTSREPGENMREAGFSHRRRTDSNRTRVFDQKRGVSEIERPTVRRAEEPRRAEDPRVPVGPDPAGPPR